MRQYGVTPYILGAYSDCGFQLVAIGKRNAPGNPTNARFIYSDNVEKPVKVAEFRRFSAIAPGWTEQTANGKTEQSANGL
jgi:hypothetical protein